MSYLFLIPVSVGLGLTGLCGFFWAMRHDQYDDLDGAAARILMVPDRPLPRFDPARDPIGRTKAACLPPTG